MKLVFSSLIVLSVIWMSSGESVILTQSNWTTMMEGSWMVIFHAPWCPACRSTMPTWQKFASQLKDHDTRVAEIDVTTSPSLTGVFLISHLPTIVHVQDGAVRTYTGSRRPEDFLKYLKQKKWLETEPIPWYYSPSSYHMRILGYLLQISVYVRDVHSYLTEEKGFPSWLSYATLGLGTLTFGVCIGLVCVLICDFCCPPRPQIKLLLGGKQEPPGSPLDSDMDDDSDVIDDGEASDADADAAAGDQGKNTPPQLRVRRSNRLEARENAEQSTESAAKEDEGEEREEEKEEEKSEDQQRRGRRVRRRKE